VFLYLFYFQQIRAKIIYAEPTQTALWSTVILHASALQDTLETHTHHAKVKEINCFYLYRNVKMLFIHELNVAEQQMDLRHFPEWAFYRNRISANFNLNPNLTPTLTLKHKKLFGKTK